MLNARQKKFCDEYLIDLNATTAALKAGYSEKTAAFIGAENLKKPQIAEYIQERMLERAQRTELSQDLIIKDLITIKDKCMSSDKFDAKNALKALELLGKHIGMFQNKLQVESIGGLRIKWNES